MARPRKNPEDPKWQTEEPRFSTYEWNLCYASALSGLVSRGGMPIEQVVKTAAQYADAAYTEMTLPRK